MAGPADRRRALSVVAALVVTMLATAARATPSEADLRRARQLFVDAEKDEDGGRWSSAAIKLRGVAQIKRTAGVRYHIALCEENLGHLGTALDEYKAAEQQARAESADDVLRLVGRRIADVEPRLPKLTLHLVPDLPGTAVTLDGVSVPATMLGTALRVDPGAHRVDATSPDRPAVMQVVTLRERDAMEVDIKLDAPVPPTDSAVPPPAGPPAPVDAHVGGRGHARAGAILAAGGGALLAAGGVAAFVLAGNAHSRAVAECAETISTAAGACEPERNVVRSWDFAAAGAWLAAAAAGAVAVIFWGQSSPASPSARLVLAPGSVGLRGTF